MKSGRLKSNLKRITPPLIVDLLKATFWKNAFEYIGDFKTWEEAVTQSSGYDDPVIFEKVRNARLAVLEGKACYERDSVTFSYPEYVWPLLALLLWIAEKNGGSLNVIDFGGSLGTTYFQHERFFRHLKHLRWNVIEQKLFAEWGKKNLGNEILGFYEDEKSCLADNSPDVVIFSSSLQYLPDPFGTLRRLKNRAIPNFLFDRTTFLESKPDRIVIQHVPEKIYKAVFPARFFNLPKFKEFFSDVYDLSAEFASTVGDPIPLEDCRGRNKGLLFTRKDQ